MSVRVLVLVTKNPPIDAQTLRQAHPKLDPRSLVLEVTRRSGARQMLEMSDWNEYSKLVKKYRKRDPVLYQR